MPRWRIPAKKEGIAMRWMRYLMMLAALLAFTGLGVSHACGDGPSSGPATDAEGAACEKASKTSLMQTSCPVMGGKIDRNTFSDHEGKRVYFCCPSCRERFEQDPAAYVKKLEDQGITLERTPKPQATCPVMGTEIDRTIYVDHDGWRVYMCCEHCVKEFQSDPNTYMKKLKEEGVTLEKTPVEEGKAPPRRPQGRQHHRGDQ